MTYDGVIPGFNEAEGTTTDGEGRKTFLQQMRVARLFQCVRDITTRSWSEGRQKHSFCTPDYMQQTYQELGTSYKRGSVSELSSVPASSLKHTVVECYTYFVRSYTHIICSLYRVHWNHLWSDGFSLLECFWNMACSHNV